MVMYGQGHTHYVLLWLAISGLNSITPIHQPCLKEQINGGASSVHACRLCDRDICSCMLTCDHNMCMHINVCVC